METDDLDWGGNEEKAARPPSLEPWERLALVGVKAAFKEFKSRPRWYFGLGITSGDTPWATLAEDWRIIENAVYVAMEDEATRLGGVPDRARPDVRGLTLHAVQAFLTRSYPRHPPTDTAVATWGVASRLTTARVLRERESAIRQAFRSLLGKAREEGRLGPAVDQENGSWLTRQ